MDHLAIAMDIGTSGIRAQTIDLDHDRILSTVITTHHPLPGANVIDHLHFTLEMGNTIAQTILMKAVNQVIDALDIPTDTVSCLAVCGNPTQLSIFQGIDIRDLAYAGKRKLASIGIVDRQRDAVITRAGLISGLDLPADCQVIIPPAIRHEVGADALGMIIQTGMLSQPRTALAIDFGTNAEMALVHNDRVITASTAAGPALEGQQISCGVLAVPGAISDFTPHQSYHRLTVIGSDMRPCQGALVDLSQARVIEDAPQLRPVGITGTGTIAMIQQAMQAHYLVLPKIETIDNNLHAGKTITLTESDIQEAGKAIGALRAGQLSLCHEARICPADIQVVYLAGASGTYVDAVKAQQLGMIPPSVKTVFQVGNTSLAMARDLVRTPSALEQMIALADQLSDTHCMLATSSAFQKVYLLELSHWSEGMPMALYRKMLKRYGLPDLPEAQPPEDIQRLMACDILDVGQNGLTTLGNIGRKLSVLVDGCTACRECVDACPQDAITVVDDTTPVTLEINASLCNGVNCRRCERSCPETVFKLMDFFSDIDEKPENALSRST